MSENVQTFVTGLEAVIKEITTYVNNIDLSSIDKQNRNDLERWRTELLGSYKKVSDLSVYLSPLLNDEFDSTTVIFDKKNKPLKEIFDLSDFVLNRLNVYIYQITIQLSGLSEKESKQRDAEAEESAKERLRDAEKRLIEEDRRTLITSVIISALASGVLGFLASFFVTHYSVELSVVYKKIINIVDSGESKQSNQEDTRDDDANNADSTPIQEETS